MAKHKSEKVTLGEIIDAMDDSTVGNWLTVLGISGPKPNLQASNLMDMFAEEESYLKEHRDDLYLVSWPDHVINPRFNSDASYQLIMSDKHNRMCYSWAKNNQGFEGTYEQWNELSDEARQQYEDGAAGIGTV